MVDTYPDGLNEDAPTTSGHSLPNLQTRSTNRQGYYLEHSLAFEYTGCDQPTTLDPNSPVTSDYPMDQTDWESQT